MNSTEGASLSPTQESATATNCANLKPKSRKTSLLSKITTPLTALSSLRPPRAGKVITEFYIRLNQPHREYSPGDLVEGSVILTVEKDVRVTHLVVNLIGRVDLYGAASYSVGKKKGLNYVGPTEFEGGVILCRDQQVLCGEGRLEAGVYEFGFVVELAAKGLPSSLDFEKGSISYNISATLTRPTTIAPTRTCQHKLTLVEIVDIASLPPPKARIISLESGSKRGRIRSSHGSSDEKDSVKFPPTPNGSNPRISLDSSSTVNTNSKLAKKGVAATIEVLKAGCLRGETIPLRVNIAHTKPIKSLHGIIVTLVRQGRFDTYPISSTPNSKSSSASLKKGLSLGFGGSITTFRKDLSQVIMPLIVDPHSLTASVKATIRVPEDAFPTINNVPGQIVSFRYFVEVVVDLGGKLAGKEDFLNGVGMVSIPGATNGELGVEGAKLGSGAVDSSGMMAVYGAKVVETDRIRREVKNVVSCRFEIIVGTTDSASGVGRRRPNKVEISQSDSTNVMSVNIPDRGYEDYTSQRHAAQAPEYADYEEETLRSIVLQSSIGAPGANQLSPTLTPYEVHLPPPVEAELDEKTRLRLAEQALLPSEPPGFSSSSAAGPSSHTTDHNAPSAPTFDGYDVEPPRDFLYDYTIPSASAPRSSIYESVDNDGNDLSTANIEDKGELERRRLLAVASAPPLPERGASRCEPSAPFLTEDGELPRYER